MKVSVCYIDEAGCTGIIPSAISSIQPALVISALIVDFDKIKHLTTEFLQLKLKYFPGHFSAVRHDLEALRMEIKGADIRHDLRFGKHAKIQQRQKFLDDLFSLLEAIDAKLLSKIWIKGIGQPFDGRAVYTSTTQWMARLFQEYLYGNGHGGIVIGDFRDPRSNSHIAHSVFTQKYKKKRGGDAFPNLIEAPTFGISDNHAGLQITDLLTSAIIYPIATHLYCTGYVRNCHVNPADATIHARYKNRLKRLQYSPKIKGAIRHGIEVSDRHAAKTSFEIFR
jgi:hypothetical protein